MNCTAEQDVFNVVDTTDVMGCSDSKRPSDNGWNRSIMVRSDSNPNGPENRYEYSRNVSIDSLPDRLDASTMEKYCDRMEERIKLTINQRFSHLETCVTTIYMGAEVRLGAMEKKLKNMEETIQMIAKNVEKQDDKESDKSLVHSEECPDQISCLARKDECSVAVTIEDVSEISDVQKQSDEHEEMKKENNI
ncbi:hypothetical protein R5R35_002518 [Gryllus longicercus]|uniref:Uncharacterized protein n=1 Tax=Gryllus longicercus TaxID=2509291 RepID=A0AAN9Z4J4_9ORTH